MTWAEVEQLLPNGFHDARLDSIAIDYRRHRATLEMELWVVEDWPTQSGAVVPELYRRGRLTLTGLLACAVDVPNGEYQDENASALWVDIAPADASLPGCPSWPQEPLPEGASVRWFYFQNDAASYVRIATRDVHFEWLGEARILDETV